MASSVGRSNWVLLSPQKLPPASQVSHLLGAIVLDFEDPLAESVPDDIRALMDKFRKNVIQTEEENFETLLSQGLGRQTRLRLSDIARLRFQKDVANSQSMKSVKVTTHWLKQQRSIFKTIKAQYQDQ